MATPTDRDEAAALQYETRIGQFIEPLADDLNPLRCVLLASKEAMPAARRMVYTFGSAQHHASSSKEDGSIPLDATQQTPRTVGRRANGAGVVTLDWQIWDLPGQWPPGDNQEVLRRTFYQGPADCPTRCAIVVVDCNSDDSQPDDGKSSSSSTHRIRQQAQALVSEARQYLAPGRCRDGDKRTPHVPLLLVGAGPIVGAAGSEFGDGSFMGKDASGLPAIQAVLDVSDTVELQAISQIHAAHIARLRQQRGKKCVVS